MRVLQAREVTFTIDVEAELMDVEGNFMCTDDDAADQAAEAEVRKRLNRGETEAWCMVIVKAKWTAPDGTSYEGVDTLGGVSLQSCFFARDGKAEAELEEHVAGHEMRVAALGDLNEQIRAVVTHARTLTALLDVTAKPPTNDFHIR